MTVPRSAFGESSVDLLPTRGWRGAMAFDREDRLRGDAAAGAVASSNSTAGVCSETCTRTIRPRCTRPSATLWRRAVILPVALLDDRQRHLFPNSGLPPSKAPEPIMATGVKQRLITSGVRRRPETGH